MKRTKRTAPRGYRKALVALVGGLTATALLGAGNADDRVVAIEPNTLKALLEEHDRGRIRVDTGRAREEQRNPGEKVERLNERRRQIGRVLPRGLRSKQGRRPELRAPEGIPGGRAPVRSFDASPDNPDLITFEFAPQPAAEVAP